MSFPSWLRTTLFGLGPRDVAVTGQHFRDAPPPIRARLDGVVEAFVAGYNLAMAADTVAELATQLEAYEHERRGFAYEGAGMAAGIRAMITPGSTFFTDYLRGPGDAHHYMILIGAGWAMARVPVRHDALLRMFASQYHWLAYDGWGFHEVFFHKEKAVDRMEGRPPGTGYAGRAWDQGVGRALWFADCASPTRIAATIGRFAPERHADLWGGVGLAATYAGGVPDEDLREVVTRAGPHAAEAGVGSLMAFIARERARNLAPHNARGVETLTGWDVARASAECADAIRAAPEGDEHYPRVRAILAERLAARAQAAK